MAAGSATLLAVDPQQGAQPDGTDVSMATTTTTTTNTTTSLATGITMSTGQTACMSTSMSVENQDTDKAHEPNAPIGVGDARDRNGTGKPTAQHPQPISLMVVREPIRTTGRTLTAAANVGHCKCGITADNVTGYNAASALCTISASTARR